MGEMERRRCSDSATRFDVGQNGRRLLVVLLLRVMIGVIRTPPLADAEILREKDPVILRPPTTERDLYFGFSLTHYTNNSQTWMLVGAPRSRVSKPEVTGSGGLYTCSLGTSSPKCDEVKVNLANNGVYPIWAKSNNSGQGLGFSVASDGETIVVCAPQWFASVSKYNVESLISVGMCFAAKSPAYEFKSFSPPFEYVNLANISFLTTGSCQFGMSATHVKGKDTFAFGAPGCWNWEGDTWEVKLSSSSDVKFDSLRSVGNVKNNSLERHRRYLGYSVASLIFGHENTIASAIPRVSGDYHLAGGQMYGPKILILRPHPDKEEILTVIHEVSHSNISSSDIRFAFFGYSLAAVDLNGDARDDLVVGAPLYMSKEYDQGAIFVYMQTVSAGMPKMKEEYNAPQRMGNVALSRFGTCVASIGDVDGDGYQDLAVGAPFMPVTSNGGSGAGAVYIYMGSRNGLETEPWQIIRAKENNFGFGSSISQQLPSIKGEGFDVAVGAFKSDTVFIFQSKEVVDITFNLSFPNPINLSKNDCIHPAGYPSPCVDLNCCVTFQKKITKPNGIDILSLFLIVNVPEGQIFTFDGEMTMYHTIINLAENELKCVTIKVLGKPDIQEIKTYTFEGSVEFAPEEHNVVIARHSVLTKSADLQLFLCNSTNVEDCKSDLFLQVEILENYVLTATPMKISCKVKNKGEIAYELRITIRSNDAFNHDVEGDQVICDDKLKEIDCYKHTLGNNEEAHFNLSLIPKEAFFSSLETHPDSFSITVEVTTMSDNKNNDSVVTLEAPIIVEGSLQLLREISVSSVDFNISDINVLPSEAETEEQLGPEIIHKYKILNPNKFSIYESELMIQWPHTLDGNYFLYLMEDIKFEWITPSCQYPSDMVDPANLRNAKVRAINVTKSGNNLLAVFGDNHPKYKTITCSLGEITREQEITVSLRSRLVLRTLFESGTGTAVEKASSFAELRITRMPLGYPPPQMSNSSIETIINYREDTPKQTDLILWIVLSAVGGLILLGLITFGLWRCGFFKRKYKITQDNAEGNQEQQQLTERKLEEEDDHMASTPRSPMLLDTENAADDFVFRVPP